MKSIVSKLKGKEIHLFEQTVLLYKNLQHPQTLAKLFLFYSKFCFIFSLQMQSGHLKVRNTHILDD